MVSETWVNCMDAYMCGCGPQQNGSWAMFKPYKGKRKYLCYGFVNCYNCAGLFQNAFLIVDVILITYWHWNYRHAPMKYWRIIVLIIVLKEDKYSQRSATMLRIALVLIISAACEHDLCKHAFYTLLTMNCYGLVRWHNVEWFYTQILS